MSLPRGAEPPLLDLAGRFFGVVRREIAALGARFPGLRASHFRLLSLIPDEGARISDLAEEALMSKQALGQFARYLEGLGYVTINADQVDRRAKIVTKSRLGRDAERAGLAVVAQVEETWREQIGSRRYSELRRTLEELGAEVDR